MAALAATAASMALPPCSSIWAPILDASGCSLATIPWREITIERAWDRVSATETNGKVATANSANQEPAHARWQGALAGADFIGTKFKAILNQPATFKDL